MENIKTYLNGRVKIIHGDCTDVLKSVQQESIDIVLTDPPYGHGNNDGDLNGRRVYIYKKKLNHIQNKQILNDKQQSLSLFEKIVLDSKRVLKNQSVFCTCCGGGGGGKDLQFANWSNIIKQHLVFRQMIPWHKGFTGIGWHYRRDYELILVASKGNKMNWYSHGKAVSNIITDIPNDRNRDGTMHPNHKPVKLALFFLNNHSQENDLVLDPFMGGGSTLEACIKSNRRYIGIELDEQWFNYSCERAERLLKQQTLL